MNTSKELPVVPSKQRKKKLNKQLQQFVKDGYEFSKELLEEINAGYDKRHWHIYANQSCKVCYGRGVNEVTHPNQQEARIVPCDCAILNRRKEEVYESKPLYGVDNGTKTLYYQKTKNDKFFVPEGWEKAEKVFV